MLHAIMGTKAFVPLAGLMFKEPPSRFNMLVSAYKISVKLIKLVNIIFLSVLIINLKSSLEGILYRRQFKQSLSQAKFLQ